MESCASVYFDLTRAVWHFPISRPDLLPQSDFKTFLTFFFFAWNKSGWVHSSISIHFIRSIDLDFLIKIYVTWTEHLCLWFSNMKKYMLICYYISLQIKLYVCPFFNSTFKQKIYYLGIYLLPSMDDYCSDHNLLMLASQYLHETVIIIITLILSKRETKNRKDREFLQNQLTI